MKVTDEMVTRFLSWPLPDNVQPDGVYPAGDYRKKWGHALMGTNLLDATAAKAMLEHVLAAPPAPDSAKLVSELRLMAHFADKYFPKAHELLAGAANWIEQHDTQTAQDEQPYFDYNAVHGIPAAQPTGIRYFMITESGGQGGNFLIADCCMKLGDLVDMCGDGKSCAVSVQEYPGMTAEQYEQLGEFDGF